MAIKLKKSKEIYIIELDRELDLYNAYKVNYRQPKGVAASVFASAT